jgi:hypothetical protein
MLKMSPITKPAKRKADDNQQLPPAKKVPLTDFAQIYSHPPRNPLVEDCDDESKTYHTLENYIPLKSGNTPLYPGPCSTQDEWIKYRDIEYQKRRFKCTLLTFTSSY